MKTRDAILPCSESRDMKRIGRGSANSESGLFTKMKQFDFEVKDFIKCIEERPCLWNKTLESYKDRGERKTAWHEICTILRPDYNELPSEEQQRLFDGLLSKWTNIRDCFVKTIKKKGYERNRKRPYVLYENLKFLLINMPEINGEDRTDFNKDSNSNTSVKEEEEGSQDEEDEEPKRIKHQVYVYENVEANSEDDVETVTKQTSSKRRRLKRQTKPRDESPNSTQESTDIPIDDRVMNEDEAFFASLLPSVVKYSEEERLEFRIEVLAVMKRISDKRNLYK